MTQQIKRVSELPTTTSTDGLYTLGVDAKNEGVKIPLGDLLGKINDTTSTLDTAINTEIAGRKAADLTKKNNDYVVSVDIVSGYVPMSDGNSYLLLDVDWETLADVIRNGNCDIVVADTHFNYKLEHVWITEDGMPYGNKLLSDNRIIRVRTFEDTNGYLRVVYDSIESDALRKTPQVLSESEQQTARENIGAQGQLRTSADLALSSGNVLSLTEMAKKRLFIDLWNQAAGDFGRYNEDTGYFELYEIYDIGWDEALLIYRISGGWDYYNVNYYWSGWGANYGFNPRAYLPLNSAYNGEDGVNVGSQMHNDSIEYLSLCRSETKDARSIILAIMTHGFRFGKLKKIYGIIQINTVVNNNQNIFAMPKLVYGKFKFTRNDYKIIYFRAPLLDYASTSFLFTGIPKQNANGQCVFKLAVNMYNRLSGTATDYDISGGTKAEWMAIADLAASKNITLATE